MVKGYKYYSSLCPFSEDEVVCPHRKHKGFSFSMCLRCSRYEQFMLAMADEDERVMDEIDRERKLLDRIAR